MMNSIIRSVIVFIFVLFTLSISAQNQVSCIEKGLKSITEKGLEAQLQFLSSDWFEGREAATEGAFKAADYIASQFGAFDIDAYVEGNYFQEVGLLISENQRADILLEKGDNGQHVVERFKPDVDYRASRIISNQLIGGQILFGAYGLELKQGKEKALVLLRVKGFSSDNEDKFAKMNERKLLQLKDEAARQAGFSTILEIDPEFQAIAQAEELLAPSEKELTKYSSGIYQKRFELEKYSKENGLNYIRISPKMADAIYPNWNENLDVKDHKPVVITNCNISIDCKFDQQHKTCRNVLAVIEGEQKDEIIVVGAHYDHLGKYDGYIWNGADDNGSGTIGMLAIARAFKESGVKPKRTIVFAAWTAEERGLLGSNYFVKSHLNPEQIKYYHNYDMIGREGDIKKRDMNVSFMYSGTWPHAEEVVKSANEDHKLGLNIRYSAMENPVAGSDNASFARVDIPIMWFHTGGHPDYHGPMDHADKINYKKMAAIVKASYLSIWKLANE